LWYISPNLLPESATPERYSVLTIDDELSVLEDQLRRLKIEYDIYFGGGAKKPPAEIEWKVKNLLKKFSDGNRMNYTQRFRYSTLQQRYALYNSLWQQKLQIKEEGYRRPQDAYLGIQGLRDHEQHEAEKAIKHHGAILEEENKPFSIACADPRGETRDVEALFNALSQARTKAGEKSSANIDSFKKFVQQKTTEIRKQYGCQAVEYSIEMQAGKVKLKAKPKT
jgi:hypothetical protein